MFYFLNNIVANFRLQIYLFLYQVPINLALILFVTIYFSYICCSYVLISFHSIAPSIKIQEGDNRIQKLLHSNRGLGLREQFEL